MLSISLILIILTGIASYQGFNNSKFFSRYSLDIHPIRKYKEYDRFLSSGFLHVDWVHFGVNMYVLYIFSSIVGILGNGPFLLLYFGSMLSGSLLAYVMHKNDTYYRAVGASGAVAGLVYAFIVIFPQAPMGFLFLPFRFPAWVFGLGYLVYSIYGMESRRDNIGHDAHLGGAIGGAIITAVLQWNHFLENWEFGLIVLSPVVAYTLYKSGSFKLPSSFKKKKGYQNIDDDFNEQKLERKKELDELLEKVGKKGIDSLSQKEKNRLEELSQ